MKTLLNMTAVLGGLIFLAPTAYADGNVVGVISNPDLQEIGAWRLDGEGEWLRHEVSVVATDGDHIFSCRVVRHPYDPEQECRAQDQSIFVPPNGTIYQECGYICE